MFTAHMGWMDLTAAMPLAERAALAAIRADSEDPWAHNALGHVHLFARRFEDSLAEFETALRLNPNFALAQGYYGLSLSYSGRWQRGGRSGAPRAAPEPARSVFAGVFGHCGLRAISRRRLRGSDAALRARRCASAAISSARIACWPPPPGWRASRRSRPLRCRSCRRAQPNISLAWIADYMPIKLDADREHYLEGFRRAGLD